MLLFFVLLSYLQSPLQSKGMNRGVWKKLETWTRHLLSYNEVSIRMNAVINFHSSTFVQDVIVISGPVFLPRWCEERRGYIFHIETIGQFPNLIHVPTHYFKIILTRRILPHSKDNAVRVVVSCGAFLIPNTDRDESRHSFDLYSVIYDFICALFEKIGATVNVNEFCMARESIERTAKCEPVVNQFIVRIDDLVSYSCIQLYSSGNYENIN